jgi:hypothetical protein
MKLITKLYSTVDGDVMLVPLPPFVDTHPTHSTRIQYLTNFIEQNLPCELIKVSIQKENDSCEERTLSIDDSQIIRTIIKNSAKNIIFGPLEKIVIVPDAPYCNVRLYYHGDSKHFSPYDFDESVLKENTIDIIGIIKTIMAKETKKYGYFTVSDNCPTSQEELNDLFTSPEDLKKLDMDEPNTERRFILIEHRPNTKENYYLYYIKAAPLSVLYEEEQVQNSLKM